MIVNCWWVHVGVVGFVVIQDQVEEVVDQVGEVMD